MRPRPPELDKAPAAPASRAPVGILAVAKTMFFGLLMIGKKETWERDGVGARMTPAQIVVGALVGGIVVVALLLLLVRAAIG